MDTLYDGNCSNSLFELKELNTHGHKFTVKQSNQEPALGNLLRSLPGNVVEPPHTDTIKNRFDRHCRERKLLFDVDIDYANVHALST